MTQPRRRMFQLAETITRRQTRFALRFATGAEAGELGAFPEQRGAEF
jgi:hypothetical protein